MALYPEDYIRVIQSTPWLDEVVRKTKAVIMAYVGCLKQPQKEVLGRVVWGMGARKRDIQARASKMDKFPSLGHLLDGKTSAVMSNCYSGRWLPTSLQKSPETAALWFICQGLTCWTDLISWLCLVQHCIMLPRLPGMPPVHDFTCTRSCTRQLLWRLTSQS